MIRAEIIKDSTSREGYRLITMKVVFPRYILAEFNTHRMFSRNSASSRAIPFKKMLQMVKDNPFIPIAWMKDHKGMQGTEYITDENDFGAIQCCIEDWLKARDNAINIAKSLHSLDVTKQLCNRLLEPFMWHTVLVTANESSYQDFFRQRCPNYMVEGDERVFYSRRYIIEDYPDMPNTPEYFRSINKGQADIHMMELAECMYDAMMLSDSEYLEAGEWHIPFGDDIDLSNPVFDKYEDKKDLRVKIATARCARISYQTLGDSPKIDYEADLDLYERLLNDYHMSPFEHCAMVMHPEYYNLYVRGIIDNPFGSPLDVCGWSNNFRGFVQFRHILKEVHPHEYEEYARKLEEDS